MESVNCPVCESDSRSVIMSIQGFAINQCSRCGMAYVSPRLTSEELIEFYDTHYHEYEGNFDFNVARNKGAIDLIRKYKRAGRMLDVGSSVGSMLQAAKPYFDATGVELARWAVESARSRGLTVVQGTLENAVFQSNSFDVVTFTELIEHLHFPLKFLIEVRRILKPDGVVYLTTGNINGWRAKHDLEDWYYLNPKFHISYFSPATIRELMHRAGFEIVHLGGLFPLRGMLGLWKYYPNKVDFLKGCIGKISFMDFTFGDMGVVAKKINV